MFRSFFGRGRGGAHCKGGRRFGGGRGGPHPLHDFMQGVEVKVVSNTDRKTIEMGLCTGTTIRIVENRPGDANMVIASGEGRYIIAKETAAKIRVC